MASVLELSAALGFRSQLGTSALAWVSDSDVQFAVSPRTIVRFDTETRMQRAVHASQDAVAITAMTVSYKGVVAFAEFSRDRVASVVIFEWPSEQMLSAADVKPLTQRRRRMAGIDHGNKPITCLRFTPDGRGLLVASAPPDVTLHLFAWERGTSGRLLAVARSATGMGSLNPHPLVAIDASPYDGTLIACCGSGVLRWYRHTDGGVALPTSPQAGGGANAAASAPLLKPVSANLRREPGPFTCQAWLPEDRFIAGTATGELWLFENLELKRLIDAPDSGPGAGLRPIASITQYTNKGFLVGADSGVLRLYEKSEDARLFFRTSRTFIVPPSSANTSPSMARISCIAVSANEEFVALATAGGQSFIFPIASYELLKGAEKANPFKPLIGPCHTPWAGASALATPAGQSAFLLDPLAGTCFEPMATPLATLHAPRAAHVTGIVSLDLCLRKPILVSVGADHTVCFWNLTGLAASAAIGGAQTSVTAVAPQGGPATVIASGVTPALEFSHTFTEAPGAVALHPSGFYVAIALESNVTLASITLHSLSIIKELPLRSASALRFSNAGAMFAVATGTNIVVYNTFSCSPLCNLRGHADRVQALVWSRDDRSLTSVAKDGIVIRWAVVMPNAIAGGGVPTVASVTGQAPPTVGVSDVPPTPLGARDSSGALLPLTGPTTLVGRALTTVESKDLIHVAIALAPGDNRDLVYLAGIPAVKDNSHSRVTFASTTSPTSLSASARHLNAPPVSSGPVLRMLDMSVPDKKQSMGWGGGGDLEDKRYTLPTDGTAAHALAGVILTNPSGSARLLLAGMGHRDSDLISASAAAAAAAENDSRSHHHHALGLSASSTMLSGVEGGGSETLSPSRRLGGLGGEGSPTPMVSPLRGAAAATSTTRSNADTAGLVRAFRLPLAAGAIARGMGAHASEGRARKGASVSLDSAPAHGGPVTAMAVSMADDRLVVTGGADGTIAVWRISAESMFAVSTGGLSGGTTVTVAAVGDPLSGSGDKLGWAEEVLSTRHDLEISKREKAELQKRLADIIVANRYAERQREELLTERTLEVEERYASELADARDLIEAERIAKVETEIRCADALKSLRERQSTELDELVEMYTMKIEGELARLGRLEDERDAKTIENLDSAARLAVAHEEEIAALRIQLAAAFAAEEAQSGALEAEAQALGENAAKTAQALDEDLDVELEDTRARLEVRVQAEGRQTLQLRGENGFLKRKFVGVTKDLAEQREELAALAETERDLTDKISTLSKDVMGLKKEIRERESLMADKDARAFDIKKKNQELEKFKFVLNYKIQELKRQVLPRKREIGDLRGTLKDMESELLTYHTSHAALDLAISELRLKRNGVAREAAKLRASIGECESRIDGVQHEMAALGAKARLAAKALESAAAANAALKRSSSSPSGKRVPSGRSTSPVPGAAEAVAISASASTEAQAVRSMLLRIYHKYIHNVTDSLGSEAVQGVAIRADGTLELPVGAAPEEVAREIARTRGQMEQAVTTLSSKVASDASSSAGDAARLVRENTLLLGELNTLRRELLFSENELKLAQEAAAARSATTASAHAPGVQGGGLGAAAEPAAPGEGASEGLATASKRKGASLPFVSGSAAVTAAPLPRSTAPSFTRRTAAVLGVVGSKGVAEVVSAALATVTAVAPMRGAGAAAVSARVAPSPITRKGDAAAATTGAAS